MPQDKITIEQFTASADEGHRQFVFDLHDLLMQSGCVLTIEDKSSGLFASYKRGKPSRALFNLGFKKSKMFARIYGENTKKYPDLFDDMPQEMVDAIAKSGDCKKMVGGNCGLKCTGYDVTIGGGRYQKCKYGCFTFTLTDASKPCIMAFVRLELDARD